MAKDTLTQVTVTVPVIKGTIPQALVAELLKQGYKKARAVVVYPNAQDRRVVCQGVVNPTLYTDNHRGWDATTAEEKDDITRDLYAQSSWFFRPKYTDTSSDPQGTINTPKSTDKEIIGYYTAQSHNGDMVHDTDPVELKRTEIQGNYKEANSFRVDWTTLTFHSPDVEFDDTLKVLDYTSSDLFYKRIGNAEFRRTFSDIDIQTESPTISDRGSGFVKKSFTGVGAQGIISGLFWDDYVVDENREDSDSDWHFEAYNNQKASAKWMVYLWNKTGSLNNDAERPADKGVRSAVLKRKIISNLRYAETVGLNSGDSGAIASGYNTQLFDSEELEILKLDTMFSSTTSTNDARRSYIYSGNVDTMLIPDTDDGMYFAYEEPLSNGSKDFYVDFSHTVNCKVCANVKDDNSYVNYGIWTWEYLKGSLNKAWQSHYGQFDQSPFYGNVADGYRSLALKKDPVRMKYKSTPHLVLTQKSGKASWLGNIGNNQLPIFELRRPIGEEDKAKLFGGQSQDAKKENVWIPCGEPVRLDKPETDGSVKFEYSWGDTYYQRWDCLKTYAFTPEDINQVVEIGSFMLESRINIDGRYDRNRGQLSNLYMSPRNFNLLNPVYSQLNNFFTYKIQDADTYKEKRFPNLITWSKTKTSGADVDLWTNVTLASTMEMDGDKGQIRKLARFNDQLLSFQDKGISQILYNENVQISSTDGVPIEIANSGKVQGKRYLSDSVGCSDKWSIAQTPVGIYFMDSFNKSIFLFNGQLNNLSGTLGMNTWCKQMIPDSNALWDPYDGFNNFVAYADNLNQDVLFINKGTALAYSEKLNAFTSFYDYGKMPYFCNFEDTGVWVQNWNKFVRPSVDSDLILVPMVSLWKHQAGDYCNFFGINKPYWMTLVGNPEPQADKIFTNLEFRACVEGDGELDYRTGKFTPTLPFDSLETWNEYQHGIASLGIRNGHSSFLHHTNDNNASLKRKFRIWRCDIPRDNYPIDPEEAKLGISRFRLRPNDRMRNPWLYVKLMKEASESATLKRAEIHDLLMTYFT